MPTQAVEIQETVAALRRKLRRDRQALQQQPAQIATNRGNKLKSGTRFVHAGSLPWRSGFSTSRSGLGERHSWTESVNHAGYERNVLARNPRRYDQYGDELDQSESDPEADADAEEENPYGNIKLEELLRPITHPSDLPTHPTLSHAYTDPALPEMARATEAKIREERNNLWRAKNLYRYFTGDETWMPCERAEGVDDWELFEPRYGFSGATRREVRGGSPSKRRRLNGLEQHDAVDFISGGRGDDHGATMNGTRDVATEADNENENMGHEAAVGLQQAANNDEDTSMMEAGGVAEEPKTNGVHENGDGVDVRTLEQQNGPDTTTDMKDEFKPDDRIPSLPNQNEVPDPGQPHHNDLENEDMDDRPSTASTPPPPPRRITRALAAEADNASNVQIASPPPTSPTLSSHSASAFEPHPMFLLPPHIAALHAPHPAHSNLSLSLAHSGLPPDELLETRKLLSLYIQKSEETIRGLENIQGKLIKAKRRRDRVFQWCRAEGHVGELSDGEDWIDEGYWGLEKGELRKGRDEDGANIEVVVTVPGGAAAGEAVEGESAMTTANAAVVMGGRKGKRRRGGARE